ncbi:hypothetical protein TGAM01_v204252 [Trichoderma gamsii]|uniref:Secreted protein n=1 Tax=Trichoderma gamsii TaxID=398673 RepID=A0A2P4ZR59_9HYPO|nr:hypothetical protein TGAM01_v204252 [Trichoderma gamsii]PON26751.1 hypothetical protein TGAM01_v204252 [Trichoderma gamsii]
MKISAIFLSVLLVASLGFSLSIRSPSPGHYEEGKNLTLSSPRRPPEKPPLVDDITFSWCLDYTRPETCFSRGLKHGECYNLGVLDPKMQEMLEDVGAEGGACMLFTFQNCKNHHTAAFTGQHLYTPWLCPKHESNKEKTKWNSDARSVRCCSGHPSTPWCSDLKKPHDCH